MALALMVGVALIPFQVLSPSLFQDGGVCKVNGIVTEEILVGVDFS